MPDARAVPDARSGPDARSPDSGPVEAGPSERWTAESWPDTLARLAGHLAAGARQGGCGLVGVAEAPDGAVDLHLQPVEPARLLAELTGWQAPASWRAAGMVGPASAARGDGPAGSATAVLSRPDGTLAVGVAGLGGGVRSWSTPPGRGDGRLADLCRRAVGAPTPTCPEPPGHAWVLPWLDELVSRAAGRTVGAPALGWADVAAAHPLVVALAPTSLPTPADLARAAALPLVPPTWDGLRRAVAARRLEVGPLAGHLSPAEAAWLDAGSFARRLLARRPPPPALFDALGDLLPPGLYADVAMVATAWGVDRRPTAGTRGSAP